MPATENTQTGPSGHRHGGHGGRRHSGTAAHGPPDAGVLAREAVITFLQDASKATAEREAARAGTAPAETEPTAEAENLETAAYLPDPIEAAAAKVETDIAVAHRAYEELQTGAGDAAEAAVHAAQSAMASASTAVEAERQVKIGLRLVRQNVVITTALVAVVIIILVLISTPLG
jgi:hypothetical protein